MRMKKVYYDDDVDLNVLKGKKIAVIGFGNQGRAQALNLRDSGMDLIIGNIEDEYAKKAVDEGFKVYPIGEACRRSDVIMMMIPDEVQPEVYELDVKPALHEGKTLVFASGFNVYFGFIKPPANVDTVLVAPKMIGESVRALYVRGMGAPALVAVHNDATGHALKTALAIAKGIGATRAGVIMSSFEEETVTDLFAEQALAYGQLIKLGFETLVESGYDPLVVQLELYGSGELIEISKSILRYGLVGQLSLHSTTSRYGQLSRANYVINENAKVQMRKILQEIRSGRFAEEWLSEKKSGFRNLQRLTEDALQHPLIQIEKISRQTLRINVD